MPRSWLSPTVSCFLTFTFTLATACALRAQALPNLGADKKPAPFIMALTMDKQGRVWVGTEDAGVWRYDATAAEAARWTQFTTKDGLGDDNGYALTCDHQGRIWCGHLNHGVSVWNGQTWRNYNVPDGPIGERIFSLATCPTNGDVWIGTSAGLTRYVTSTDSWTSYTRADGLPADQISALAFDKLGTLFVGTDCDGLAIGSPADNYQSWSNVRGPDEVAPLPFGKGLPCNLINDILVTRSGTVYVATTCGLARSHDNGKSWDYGRGQDWGAKVQGLLHGPPPGWQPQPGAQLEEDYVTCLAEDAAGILWLGHRRSGLEAYDARRGQQVYKKGGDFIRQEDYARAILPLPGSGPLIGWYGGGVTQAERHFDAAAPRLPLKPAATTPALPSRAQPPTLAELQALTKRVAAAQKPLAVGSGMYLGADWRTWGDWVERYGRQYTWLCLEAGHTFIYDSYSFAPFFATADLGPHHAADDFMHRQTYAMQSADPRILFDLLPGTRRGGEVSDHGEAYKTNAEGPDLWVMAQLPEGAHRATLMFLNHDGHEAANRFRDYTVELKPYTPKIEDAALLPTLARARVRDFWGPVYQQFMVRGPGKFYLKVSRNNSANTILAAVMLDRIKGPRPDVNSGHPFDPWRLPFMGGARYAPPELDVPTPPDPHALEKILAGTVSAPVVKTATEKEWEETITAARQLWRALDGTYDQADSLPLQWPSRIAAYRAITNAQAPADLLENWRWYLRLWTAGDRQEFNKAMQQARATWIKSDPGVAERRY